MISNSKKNKEEKRDDSLRKQNELGFELGGEKCFLYELFIDKRFECGLFYIFFYSDY